MWLRMLVFAVVVGAIVIGFRRIFKDWGERFRDLDRQTRERDLRERQRPDVIDLKRSDDGVYRPDDDEQPK